MTHLCIARNIQQLFPEKIGNLSQFYLGTIAPDAVHNRAGYISDFKKASHLVAGDERWGEITNTGEWTESVLGFLGKHGNADDQDFVLGYCIHVLSDIYQRFAKWNPFRFTYPDKVANGYGNILHQESSKVDIEMAITVENREDFWFHIKESKPMDLRGIIFTEEIEKQKDNILNRWYKGKERPDLSSNEVVTIESNMKLVKDATDFVACHIK